MALDEVEGPKNGNPQASQEAEASETPLRLSKRLKL